jgi:exonuclease VII large subunit
MSHDSSPVSPIFRIDVAADASPPTPAGIGQEAVVGLLRELLVAQQRQNKLLEELLQQGVATQKQRAAELQQWKEANPHLARACRRAAETLSRVQTKFLENMTVEVADQEEPLLDGEFMLNEFVDRFGPRLAHLNGVLQVLAQLGSGVPNQ